MITDLPIEKNDKQQDSKKIAIVVLVILVIILSVILFADRRRPKSNTINEKVRNKESVVVEKSDLVGDYSTDNNVREGSNSLPSRLVVSIDDDPSMGSNTAPITIVEFSDFECPYCKKFALTVLPDIKKNYIDTGKVRFVYRDLPLLTHEPVATREAIGANCARAQGGDDMYFKFHDEIFRKTKSRKKGLTTSQLILQAKEMGLDDNRFASCMSDDKYRQEVAKDFADAEALGLRVTPSFIVGKTTSDGKINGFLIDGLLPYPVWKSVLDELLTK